MCPSSRHRNRAQSLSACRSPTSGGSGWSSALVEPSSTLHWFFAGDYVLQGLHYVVIFSLLVSLSLGPDLHPVHRRNAEPSAVW